MVRGCMHASTYSWGRVIVKYRSKGQEGKKVCVERNSVSTFLLPLFLSCHSNTLTLSHLFSILEHLLYLTLAVAQSPQWQAHAETDCFSPLSPSIPCLPEWLSEWILCDKMKMFPQKKRAEKGKGKPLWNVNDAYHPSKAIVIVL